MEQSPMSDWTAQFSVRAMIGCALNKHCFKCYSSTPVSLLHYSRLFFSNPPNYNSTHYFWLGAIIAGWIRIAVNWTFSIRDRWTRNARRRRSEWITIANPLITSPNHLIIKLVIKSQTARNERVLIRVDVLKKQLIYDNEFDIRFRCRRGAFCAKQIGPNTDTWNGLGEQRFQVLCHWLIWSERKSSTHTFARLTPALYIQIRLRFIAPIKCRTLWGFFVFSDALEANENTH